MELERTCLGLLHLAAIPSVEYFFFFFLAALVPSGTPDPSLTDQGGEIL